MPALLATFAELDPIIGPGEDQALAEIFLRHASDEIRAFTRNPLELYEGDEIVLSGTGSRILLIPWSPVIAVNSVREAQWTSSPTELEGPVDSDTPAFEWDEDGILERIDGGVWARRRRWYLVNVDHGYAETPDIVHTIALELAARSFDAGYEGLSQEALGGYSYARQASYSGAGSQSSYHLTEAEKDLLADYVLVGARPKPNVPSSTSGS